MDKKKEGKKELAKKTNDKADSAQKNNNLLKIIFLIFGLVIVGVFVGYFFSESKKSFDYKGVEFKRIEEGKLTVYNTQIPVYSKSGNQVSTYNFYLRTDPRLLDKVKFNGTITPLKITALNYSSDLDCSGYGIIALTNIINIYELIGSKVVVDKNATCDQQGRYTLLNVINSDKNKIEEIGPNCYNIYIDGCDVFPSTEKFMIETFVKIKERNITAFSSA